MAATNPAPSGEVSLWILPGGYLNLPMSLFVEGAPQSEIRRVPSMCWLIQHKPSGKNLLFDLGIRKDVENYPPAIYRRLQTLIKAEIPEDVFDGLKKHGLDPSKDIDEVLFSHLHYDHTGDPAGLGPGTRFILGAGAQRLVPGWTEDPVCSEGPYDVQNLPIDRVKRLPSLKSDKHWVPFGPFPLTYDYFGDGSVIIVHSPGHCPGHINLLLHTGSGNRIYLAGDTCHDRRILDGKAQCAVYKDEASGASKSAHFDLEAANVHIKRVQGLSQYLDVEIVLAHDGDWLIENQHRF